MSRLRSAGLFLFFLKSGFCLFFLSGPGRVSKRNLGAVNGGSRCSSCYPCSAPRGRHQLTRAVTAKKRARPISRSGCCQIEFYFAATPRPLAFLSESISCRPEIRRRGRFEPEKAGAFGKRPARVVGIMIPLPLWSESWGTKVVRRCRPANWLSLNRFVHHGGNSSRRVWRATDRPIIFPKNRAEVSHAANGAAILHHKAVPLAVRQIHDGALVSAGSVVQRLNGFVGAENIRRARAGEAEF